MDPAGSPADAGKITAMAAAHEGYARHPALAGPAGQPVTRLRRVVIMRAREPIRTREKPATASGSPGSTARSSRLPLRPCGQRAERIPEVNGCACADPNPLILVTLAHPGER